jgi:hypothetical protein
VKEMTQELAADDMRIGQPDIASVRCRAPSASLCMLSAKFQNTFTRPG